MAVMTFTEDTMSILDELTHKEEKGNNCDYATHGRLKYESM